MEMSTVMTSGSVCWLTSLPKGCLRKSRRKVGTQGRPCGNSGARVFNNPCFVFQPIPEDRYKMQSKPLGICLILDCIGNDTGRCGCCRVTAASRVRPRHRQAPPAARGALAALTNHCPPLHEGEFPFQVTVQCGLG